MLYIIPTPIGNLKDITLRALEVLQSVDGIICEDTRRSSILLNHYQIKKPFLVINDYNEAKVFPQIIEKLNLGQNLALVSDAGTPLISDPGYKLVRECIGEGIEVDSLPGPSSVITALTLSGLPPDKFIFLGYLPEKSGHMFESIKNLDKKTTYIIFVAPHKLIKTLENIQKAHGDIEVVLAKELTKIHQRVESKKVSEWQKLLTNPKGEYILLIYLDASS